MRAARNAISAADRMHQQDIIQIIFLFDFFFAFPLSRFETVCRSYSGYKLFALFKWAFRPQTQKKKTQCNIIIDC